jgi:hypothetical protein
VYRVVLCGDGTVVYDGMTFVKEHGRHVRRLSLAALAELGAALDAVPDGPSPLADAIGANPPHLWHVRRGVRRWLAPMSPDGERTATVFLRATAVEAWIGSEQEREQLWESSR